jgi:hypothetical protein
MSNSGQNLLTVTIGGLQIKDWRSRPGSEPRYRTFAGIVVEGIEDLDDLVTRT